MSEAESKNCSTDEQRDRLLDELLAALDAPAEEGDAAALAILDDLRDNKIAA